MKKARKLMICRLLTVFDIVTGRGGGIRTPGPREGSPVFKTGAINRSTTPLYFNFLRHKPPHSLGMLPINHSLLLIYNKRPKSALPTGCKSNFFPRSDKNHHQKIDSVNQQNILHARFHELTSQRKNNRRQHSIVNDTRFLIIFLRAKTC